MAAPLPTDALLARLDLTGVAQTPWRRLSGGEQQRLSLALALVGRPELVFLDEPSAGLDVHARLAMWELLEELRTKGVTVVLTTHTMEEAERLADHVIVIDRGRTVASGTVAELAGNDRRSLQDVFLELDEPTGMTTLDFTPAPTAAPLQRQVGAQTRMELRLLLRNGEQLLLTIVIPTLLLIVFAKAPIADLPSRDPLPRPRRACARGDVDGLHRAGDRDRLRKAVRRPAAARHHAAPPGRPARREDGGGPRRRAATGGAARPRRSRARLVTTRFGTEGRAATVLGTVAFSALGLLMAGTLRAEATLAAANLVYLLLLVLGGVAFPLSDFSSSVRHVLDLLPIAALTDGLRAALSASATLPLHDVVTLCVWAFVTGLLAARLFRWE